MESTDVKNIFIEDNQVSWEEIEPGVKRKIMAYDDSLMMVKVQFDKGGVGSPHNHSIHRSRMWKVVNFEIEINAAKKYLQQAMLFISHQM